MSPFSGFENLGSFETLADMYESIWRNIGIIREVSTFDIITVGADFDL
jgi:hypothetical protein